MYSEAENHMIKWITLVALFRIKLGGRSTVYEAVAIVQARISEGLHHYSAGRGGEEGTR